MNLIYPFKDFYRRVRNVLRWLPTIWKDRDWDDSYITEILIKKLEFTRDFYLSNKAYSTHSDDVAKEIQEAINLLHQTKDSWEFYEEPAIDLISEKWGKTTFYSIPYSYDKDGSVLSYEMKSSTEKVITPEDEELYNKEYKKIMNDANRRYIKDKINAYKFIGKNIDKWWD